MNCLCTNLHCAILRSDSRSALEAEAIYRGGPLLYKPQRVPHARQPQSSCIVHSSNVERVSLCLSLVAPGLKLTALPVGVLPALAGQWDKTRKGKGVSDLSTDTYRGCVFWQCPPALAWLQVVMRRASCPQRYTTCRYWHILALRTRSGYDRVLGWKPDCECIGLQDGSEEMALYQSNVFRKDNETIQEDSTLCFNPHWSSSFWARGLLYLQSIGQELLIQRKVRRFWSRYWMSWVCRDPIALQCERFWFLTHLCQRLASNRFLLIYIYRVSIIIIASEPCLPSLWEHS